MDEQVFFQLISDELGIKTSQIKATVELLDTENTVPFIARYRKEVTGGLDEEQIRAIEDRMRYLRILQDRKETVLKSIDEQGKLTDELREKIESIEKKYDHQFQIVFDAIKKLIDPPAKPKNPIGFHAQQTPKKQRRKI